MTKLTMLTTAFLTVVISTQSLANDKAGKSNRPGNRHAPPTRRNDGQMSDQYRSDSTTRRSEKAAGITLSTKRHMSQPRSVVVAGIAVPNFNNPWGVIGINRRQMARDAFWRSIFESLSRSERELKHTLDSYGR